MRTTLFKRVPVPAHPLSPLHPQLTEQYSEAVIVAPMQIRPRTEETVPFRSPADRLLFWALAGLCLLGVLDLERLERPPR